MDVRYFFTACVLLCGCHRPVGHGLTVTATKAATPRSLDERLIGSWVIGTPGYETSITYSKNHRYSIKEGRSGFTTGFYNETGIWDIYLGNRIELTPENRKSSVSASDHELTAMIRSEEKAMDEGVWRPMPLEVSSIDDRTYSTVTKRGGTPTVYRRVR